MKRFSLWASAGLVVASVWAVSSAHADELQVKVWAAACASCHGTNGDAKPPMVRLAGTDAKATLDVLLAHKRGQRQGTIMHQIAKGYTDEQLAQIAQYFAAQK